MKTSEEFEDWYTKEYVYQTYRDRFENQLAKKDKTSKGLSGEVPIETIDEALILML
jgi:hypothetical protein